MEVRLQLLNESSFTMKIKKTESNEIKLFFMEVRLQLLNESSFTMKIKKTKTFEQNREDFLKT